MTPRLTDAEKAAFHKRIAEDFECTHIQLKIPELEALLSEIKDLGELFTQARQANDVLAESAKSWRTRAEAAESRLSTLAEELENAEADLLELETIEVRALKAEGELSTLTAQMENVTAQIECNWCRAHADGFDCRFCAAPRVASPNAEIKHEASCLTQLLASSLPEAGKEIG